MAIDTVDSVTTRTVSRPSTAASVGLLLARVPLGLYFILAGMGKFLYYPGGAAAFVQDNMPNAVKFMSENVARTYLTSLPYAEIALGAFLIMGLVTRVIAACMALLLISFTIANGIRVPNLPFHPNLVYLGLAMALTLCGGGWISVDGLLFRPRRGVVVARGGVVAADTRVRDVVDPRVTP
jgi:thiosulfate dehydrogenase (quinone) large subunit